MEYSELLAWADTPFSERSAYFIDHWFSALDSKNEELDRLAIYLAKSFVKNEISFDIANTLFNQIIPVAEFENVPDIFWRFYIAFEDFETFENPNIEALPRVKSKLEQVNAI